MEKARRYEYYFETVKLDKPLISIIMPAYNSGQYIQQAIESILIQSYQRFELIIINDGSTDNTAEIIAKFQDVRIKYFYQQNRGVGAARNLALSQMVGDYFCFLDSDDVMPRHSLEKRLNKFKINPQLSFVDGKVIYTNEALQETGRVYLPNFKGTPFYQLVNISSSCFFGASWMIKNNRSINYKFPTDMTHSEDLFFYLSISKEGLYDYTESSILYYRLRKGSAMKNLGGLQRGYEQLLKKTSDTFPDVPIRKMKAKIIRIMFLSWLLDGKRPLKAIASVFKLLKA